MRLDRALDRWQSAGLLTGEQATAIRAFEEARGGGAVTWVVFALGAAAGVALVAGITALVAANWEEIPDRVKLGGVGALLLGSLAGAWWTSRRRTTWPYDLCLLAHALLVPAMIGVTAQVYHLSGPPWRTLALCASLALPVAILATRSLVTDLLLGYTVGAVFATIADVDWLERWAGRGFGWGYVAVTLGALAFAGDRLARGRGWEAPAAALRRWGVGLVAVTLVVAAEVWDAAWFGRGPVPVGPLVMALVAGLGVGLWRLAPWRERGAALATLLVGAIFLGGASMPLGDRGDALVRLLGFGLFCAFCVALAMAAARAGSRRWVTVATLAIAIRTVVFYAELSGDLMSTGIGLVLTGLVIGGVAFGWWRINRVIRATLPARTEAAS